MKNLCMASFVMVAAFTGCNSGTPGGPGATKPESEKNIYDVGLADNSFTLSVPSSMPFMSTSLKQGETTKLVIGIKRGKSFQQNVSLKFEGLPSGVTIDQAGAQITRDQSEVNLTLTAIDTAPLGDFEIKVVGHPVSGGDASNKFKITVEKKETFTVSVPTFTTTVKQGETKGVSISINRDKHFNEDVALYFTNLPKGVTIEPSKPMITQGGTEAKLTLKSEADASLGDFVIKVTGHPSKGADASRDFKLSVAK